MLDTLDVRIIRQLLQDSSGSPFTSDPKWTYRKVAKALGVDQGTIRSRLNRLTTTGFLKGMEVIPNPSLIGIEFAQVWLDLDAPGKADLIRKLQLVDGVVLVVNYSGDSLYFGMMCDNSDSLKRRLELVQRFANPKRLTCVMTRFPPSAVKLSDSDRRILRLLHGKSKASYGDLAKSLGLSTKTVKRRLTVMVQGRAIFVVPKIDPKLLEGAIIADLLVRYADHDRRRLIDASIAEKLGDRLVRVEPTSEDVSFFNFVVRNLAQAQEVLDWVKGEPGVAVARVDLVQDRFEHYDRLWEEFGLQMTREAAIRA